MIVFWLFQLVFNSWGFHSDEEIKGPTQPLEGPGGMTYVHEEVLFQDFADEPDGYWLFEPASPKPDSAHVVVFNHGYGGYNPMIYGQWIRHLVRKGNIVIFPRYQKNLLSPGTKKFAPNIATGIRDALVELDTGDHVKPITRQLVLIGHSYGGVISTYLGVKYEAFGLPQPKGVLACNPGTGIFKGGKLDSYEAMPSNTKIILVSGDGDHVVGDKFSKRVFETAINTPNRNWIVQFEDEHGEEEVDDEHNEVYSVDEAFHSGHKTMGGWRSKRVSETNAADFYCFWKLADALIDCTRTGTNCNYAFGNTPEQRFMGLWSDGTPVKELEVHVPE